MTNKAPNFTEILINFHEGRINTPFEWGTNDCGLYIADAVKAMTGEDIAYDFRGKYKTETGAKRQLAKLYGGGLDKVMDAKLERIEVPFVQRGDVVLFAGDLGPTLGIYFNGGVFSSGPDGSVFLDASFDKILMAWRV